MLLSIIKLQSIFQSKLIQIKKMRKLCLHWDYRHFKVDYKICIVCSLA